MKVAPTDRLKTYTSKWKFDGREVVMTDISNDAGNDHDEYSITEDFDAEVAERLVACWNAFLGWPIEQIRDTRFALPKH